MASMFRWIIPLSGHTPPPINPGVYDVNVASLRVSKRKSKLVDNKHDWFLEIEIDKLERKKRKGTVGHG